MSAAGFTSSFTVDQNPGETFKAITDLRGWWSEEIDGSTDQLGAEFKFHYQDVHQSTQKIAEFAPGKKVVWRVVDARLNFVKARTEWIGTDIIFEIASTTWAITSN